MRKDAPIISCFGLKTPVCGSLTDVSLDVERGEWVEVIGSRGCGKSRLFDIMSLRGRPPEGRLVFGGRNIDRTNDRGVAEVRRMFGSCAEPPVLLEDRTVIENMAIPFVVRGEPRIALDVCEALLETANLLDLRDRTVESLSYQERLATGVLRAAAGGPPAILIDGVLERLDVGIRKQLIEVLRSAHLNGSAVVLFGTTFSENARRGRRFILEDGSLRDAEVPVLVTPELAEGAA